MRRRWRHWFSTLFSSEGFRGPVLTLLSGSTVVLALSYFAQPVLTRLYTPDEFGIADYFVSITVVLISFTSLRYEDALMLPEDEDEAAGVLWLALALLVGFVALFSGLLLWRHDIARWIGFPAIAPWLWLVPPTLLAMRFAKVAELWLIRGRRFRNVTAGEVSGTLVTVGSRIGAGLPPIDAGTGGLIGGFLVGNVVTMLVQGTSVLRRGARTLFRAFSWQRLRRVARRYRRFPLYATPSTLLSAVVARLPFLLLPLFFDVAVVGLFGRAFSVLAFPLGRVGGAVAQVFFVHAVEALREDRLPNATEHVHRRLVMLGLFPTLLLVLAGPDLFDVVLGTTWRAAGTYVQIIGPWLFFASVASPLTRLFDVLERQRLDFLMSALMFVALATALYLGGRTGDVTTALALLGATGTVIRIVQIGLLLRLADVALGDAVRAYGRYLIFALPGLLLVGGTLLLHRPWLTTVAAFVAMLLYGALILLKERLLIDGL